MKKSQKNSLSLDNFVIILQYRVRILILLLLFTPTIGAFSQNINIIPNPSFEDFTSCPNSSPIGQYFVKNWKSLDSINPTNCFFEYFNKCSSFGSTSIPFNSRGNQNPKTGNAYVEMQLYCTDPICNTWKRSHMRIKLRNQLTASKVYCAKIHVNLIENCKYAIDGFGMYFDNGILDTLNPCSKVITFVTPQLLNPSGNVISDTANWVAISGTFMASGNETYLTIGNFFSDAFTTKTIVNSTYPVDWSAYFIDDVSLIEYNLPASAGPDKNIALGDSAFIGRPPEIGLECTWVTGTTTIGKGGGLWVKPTTTGTFSYVVTQNICGNIKTDTVNVNVSPGSVSENEVFSQNINLFPQPAKDAVTLSLSFYYEPSVLAIISDINGREIENKELVVSNFKATLLTNQLSNGVYVLQLKTKEGRFSVKRLIIAK